MTIYAAWEMLPSWTTGPPCQHRRCTSDEAPFAGLKRVLRLRAWGRQGPCLAQALVHVAQPPQLCSKEVVLPRMEAGPEAGPQLQWHSMRVPKMCHLLDDALCHAPLVNLPASFLLSWPLCWAHACTRLMA